MLLLCRQVNGTGERMEGRRRGDDRHERRQEQNAAARQGGSYTRGEQHITMCGAELSLTCVTELSLSELRLVYFNNNGTFSSLLPHLRYYVSISN